jgi:hypothetical protein
MIQKGGGLTNEEIRNRQFNNILRRDWNVLY